MPTYYPRPSYYVGGALPWEFLSENTQKNIIAAGSYNPSINYNTMPAGDSPSVSILKPVIASPKDTTLSVLNSYLKTYADANPGYNDPEYLQILTAIQNLDISTLQNSVLNYSPAIITMFKLVASRKFLWNVVYQDPATMAKMKEVQGTTQAAVGVAGGVTAALMAAGAITAGVTALIGGVTQGIAFLSQGKIASESAQRAEDILGSYVDNQKNIYHDTLATNIYNSVVNDAWHNLNQTEGEGALIHLKPPTSISPTANQQYAYAVTNLWIEAAMNIRNFYKGFTYAVYQNAVTASKQKSKSDVAGTSSKYLIIGILIIAIILFFFVK
jgi:hypothetical protein